MSVSRSEIDIDSSSDSSSDSWLEGPNWLLPSDIADILLECEVEAWVEECNWDGDGDSDDPLHNKELGPVSSFLILITTVVQVGWVIKQATQ